MLTQEDKDIIEMLVRDVVEELLQEYLPKKKTKSVASVDQEEILLNFFGTNPKIYDNYSARDCYEKYLEFCENQDSEPVSQNKFGREVKKYYGVISKTVVDDRVCGLACWYIKEDEYEERQNKRNKIRNQIRDNKQ